MLYKQTQHLDQSVFRNPGAEYRGAPFWAWNNLLEEDELLRQIDIMKEMGLGGFHMHSRSGMAVPYLSDYFMNLVESCARKAEENGMLCWLYDEDRWPSGSAGGILTKDHTYRARHLRWTCRESQGKSGTYHASDVNAGGVDPILLASYQVVLENGFLKSYRRLEEGENPDNSGGVIWDAVLETARDNPWFNNQAYADTLNPKAVAEFIKLTHERYAQRVGGYFGKVIPAIFTDEPQFVHKENLAKAWDRTDVIVPFTDDLPATYMMAYASDLLDALPELFWDLTGGKYSAVRYRYHDHVSERFVSAFADQVGQWCGNRGIMLTGHMMAEQSLDSQSRAVGEVMRSLRSFQLPGIDMLCDRREFGTAKQAQSVAHQYGRPGVMSELYGVTNWDFDFRGHKLQGDWQAALGITVRVHHLSWVSMAGEAKRDYPASISYQSPWYREYPLIEDHFARVNSAMTRGNPAVKVGVIHPVESYWLLLGPESGNRRKRREMDRRFEELTEWLLFGHIDFDFISESLVSDLYRESSPGKFGEMEYRVIVVPPLITIRKSTVNFLKKFTEQGGQVILLEAPPVLMDAVPSGEPGDIPTRRIPFSETAVLKELEDFRDVSVTDGSGAEGDNLIYQLREEKNDRWLFICQPYHPVNPDNPEERNLTVRVRGRGKMELWDTMTGEVHAVRTEQDGEWITADFGLYPHDSLLLRIRESGSPFSLKSGGRRKMMLRPKGSPFYLLDPVPVILEEPNVLVLDQAEYAMDGGGFEGPEEILRLDTKLRKLLAWPSRNSRMAQPWVVEKDDGRAGHRLTLRFRIRSEIELTGVHLALEQAESAVLTVNGSQVPLNITGWFTDKAIKTVSLPDIQRGESVLEISFPYGPLTNPEWCYLLGNFGVAVEGARSRIIARPETVYPGDLTCQGFPFYGGNITYRYTVSRKPGMYRLELPKFRNPVISVSLDGKPAGKIALAPYTVDLDMSKGRDHTIEITVFGNRYNSFGQLHNSDPTLRWAGPNSWRTSGNQWSYTYQLRPNGLLTAPKLFPLDEHTEENIDEPQMGMNV
ncbi:MAG: hypothetical protein ACLFSE_08575 [Spirochaetia bacterium]